MIHISCVSCYRCHILGISGSLPYRCSLFRSRFLQSCQVRRGQKGQMTINGASERKLLNKQVHEVRVCNKTYQRGEMCPAEYYRQLYIMAVCRAVQLMEFSINQPASRIYLRRKQYCFIKHSSHNVHKIMHYDEVLSVLQWFISYDNLQTGFLHKSCWKILIFVHYQSHIRPTLHEAQIKFLQSSTMH